MTESKGQVWYLSLALATKLQTVELAVPLSCLQDWLTHTSAKGDNCTVLPRQGTGPFLPSAIGSEGLGQLSAALSSLP